MSYDRELLELAAKACGYKILRVYTDARCLYIDPGPNENGFHWNPLTSDGDALRLAVRLGLFIDTYGPATVVGNVVCPTSLKCKTRMEEHGDDPYAATRRTIVRAAAEIGSAMVKAEASANNFYTSVDANGQEWRIKRGDPMPEGYVSHAPGSWGGSTDDPQ